MPNKPTYLINDKEIILSNDLCRIQWIKTPSGWAGEFHINADGKWETVALDGKPEGAPYEVVEQRHDRGDDVYAYKNFEDKFKVAHMWRNGPMRGVPSDVHGAYPSADSQPTVVRSNEDEVIIQWQFQIKDLWQVEATFALRKDDYHVKEIVKFTRLKAGEPVRVRRVWHIKGIPAELVSSSARAVTHCAWRMPHGTFMALATHDGAWTPHSYGGGMVNLTLGNDFQQYADGKYQTSPDQAILHQAPPCMDRNGWLEVGKGETYTLTHFHIMHPTYHFKKEFIDYMHALQPQEYLPPRYPWSWFIDKCLWTLRNTPEGYEDGGEWGLYWKDWYNLTDDPAAGGHARIEKVHSLDWGASWDIWIAYFLLLYGRKHNDSWALERYQKIRNAIVMLDWQVDDPASPVNGAIWMERDEAGDFHISNWMAKDNPKILWVCDTGKVGYFMCLLYEKTKDEPLLTKAIKAADFLLRVQKDNGDLQGSVFDMNGKPTWHSNLGGVTSAVLLWGKLYEMTKDERYLAAARKSADFSHSEWLSNDAWQLHGGEIDSFGFADSTTSMYAMMGYAALAMATGEEAHKNMTRDAANHHFAQQWLFDIHYGYYRKEARWNGMDCKTVGAFSGWIRPEATMCMYMAWKATGDDCYRFSMEQHAAWMTYMQYDNPDSPRSFGGGHEVFEVPADQINGFGGNFWPEVVGQAIALLETMEEDEAKG
jgi:hypothetical protein